MGEQPPEFRKSQGVVPFGVGAMVTFPDDSLMMAGLDMWPQSSSSDNLEVQAARREATRIVDGRLQQRLSARFARPIRSLFSPTEAPPGGFGFIKVSPDYSKAYMPFVRFPHWHFCPRCRSLWDVPWNTPVGDKVLRCESSNRLREGSGKTCAELFPKYRPVLIPVRFTVACTEGHIMDFPWADWVHRNSTPCDAGSGNLFLTSTGSAGLVGIAITCASCKARSTLAGAFSENAFNRIWPNGCPGERPWLGPHANQPECSQTPVTIQRGAANAYFGQTMNSILIPPHSEKISKILDRPDVWDEIISLIPDGGAAPLIDGKPYLPTPWLNTKAKYFGIDPNDFLEAVKQKLGYEQEAPQTEISEVAYRETEYKAFLGPRPPQSERHDFDLVEQNINEYEGSFRQYFERVILLPTLRETRVLLGFTRVIPPESGQDLSALSLQSLDWLPAAEVRGEGIFIVFNNEKLNTWRKTNPEVIKRTQSINKRLFKVAKERSREDPEEITPDFLLVHSFAHALIRQLTFDCGYDSSSIRERLYIGQAEEDNMAGLLIYTASGDSEGTLGGLVRQGRPGKLEATFHNAIKNARICSSDPLCSESTSQGTNGLNLSACHACMLVPETACEVGNRLLDRIMLIGWEDQPDLGFFGDTKF